MPLRKSQSLPRYRTDSERWSALMNRDARADGMFVYSVRTTGVYCRPACPSRLAHRENVAFHANCDAAERAGYRPCKRCHPDRLPRERQAGAVAQACRLIAGAHELPGLSGLAASVGLSAFHFHRVFKKTTGLTPKEYGIACRAERLRAELPRARTIIDAVYGAGFNSSARFYEKSNETLGMAATTFRDRGRGEHIRFGTARTALGCVLVAATRRGVCSIALGDHTKALVSDLRQRFSNATLTRDRAFSGVVAKVAAHIEAPHVALELPLDIRGTVFQQRVWHALRAIPAGKTLSYKQLAEQLDAPRSARAVARACASNVIAVVIPCHRAIGSDGALAGYRWGVARKRELLDREQPRD